MFKRIVVGLDGSQTSENALRLACNIAQKYDSDIYLVHTPQPKTVAFALGAVAGYHTVTTMPSTDDVKKAGEKIINSGQAIAEGFKREITRTEIQLGDPADNIVKYANSNDADLIVTGRRGLGTAGSLMQGSTSQRVNHLAECACLSVV